MLEGFFGGMTRRRDHPPGDLQHFADRNRINDVARNMFACLMLPKTFLFPSRRDLCYKVVVRHVLSCRGRSCLMAN